MNNAVPWLFLLLLLWIGGLSFVYYNSGCCPVVANTTTNTTSKTTTEPIKTTATTAIMTEVPIVEKTGNLFEFYQSGNLNITPTSTLQDSIQGIVSYLDSHPNQHILLTGRYDANNESRPDNHPNLGMARALDIKRILIEQGINPNSIHINTSVNEDLNIENRSGSTIVTNGIDLDYSRHSNSALASLKSSLKPILVYFNKNQSGKYYFAENEAEKRIEQIFTAENLQDLSNLIKYWHYNPSTKVYVTGHASQEGEDNINAYLSRKRAEFVEKYLTVNGVNPDNIIVRYRSDNQPQVTEYTESDRRQNRRVVISIE